MIKLQELRKEAKKIAESISVRKFYGNRKNNNDDTNLFKGWMDRGVHEIQMVCRRHSGDDFDINYSNVKYTLKNKDDVEDSMICDSAAVPNESENVDSPQGCEGSDIGNGNEESGEEIATKTGNESDGKDENGNEKDIKQDEKNKNGDVKNEKDEKADEKDEKVCGNNKKSDDDDSTETEDTTEAVNALLLFQKGSIR